MATSIAKIGLCWTSLKDGRKDRTGAKACLAAASGWPIRENWAKLLIGVILDPSLA